MRKNVTVLLTLLLFATVALAQTSSSGQNQTTSTTTTPQTTTSGPSRSVEGCIVKEGSDFFLVPRAGNPILLQPNTRQDLNEHKGHEAGNANTVRGEQPHQGFASAQDRQ